MVETNDKSSNIENYFKIDSNHIVFSSDDQKLKTLGEIFGNPTSRSMITIMIENELTAMQISDKLGLKINLVMYHLEKMLDIQIISITKQTKNSRGHQVNHYRAKQAVMIFSRDAKYRADKSKMLSDVIKRITKFSAIGIAGVFTWFVTSINIQADNIANSIDTALKYPRPTMPQYMTPIEPQSGDVMIPVVFGVATIGLLLILDRIFIPRIHLHHKPKN